MECPSIKDLELTSDDFEVIESIHRRQRAGKMLEVVMPAGVLTTIFLGNNAAQATFNVTQADFVLFAKAMTNVNAITRRVIRDEATRQAISSKTTKQRRFWTAIARGCEGTL